MAHERAAIYLRTCPFVFDIPADLREKLNTQQVERLREPLEAAPIDVQERACRAYCERMGYAIFGVYRADAPPPKNVKPEMRIRIAPEPIKMLYEYDSRHPYYWVRNLLEMDAIDVVVEFRASGPSGSRWSDVPEDLAKELGRFEYASRWEVEPPTGVDLRIYEIAEALAHADTEAESAPLRAELEALTKQAKQAREGSDQHEVPAAPSDNDQAVKDLHKAQRSIASTKRALSSARQHAPALQAQLAQLEARAEALRRDVQRLTAEAEALAGDDAE
jgi:hypothetical protein